MNRLNLIDPSAATGKAQELFQGPLKGKHFNIFKAMANSPAALQAYLGFSGALHHAALSPKEQEIIQLAVGEANGCDYCLAAHTAIGKSLGLSDDQTKRARAGLPGDSKLDALVTFVRALHEKHGHVADTDLQAFRSAGYGDAHIAEVVASYALATFTNYFNHVNQTAVDFPPAPRL